MSKELITYVRGTFEPKVYNVLSSLTATTTNTAATRSYGANQFVINNYTGAAAQAVTLPAATAGTMVIHYQSIDTTDAAVTGTATLTFDCAGTDVYRTGSIIQAGAAAAGNTFDTSDVGETLITFTPASTATNFVSRGSQFIFWCVDTGIWEVKLIAKAIVPFTAVNGAVAFGA